MLWVDVKHILFFTPPWPSLLSPSLWLLAFTFDFYVKRPNIDNLFLTRPKHDPTLDYASSEETSRISYVFNKKNVETCCWHQRIITYPQTIFKLPTSIQGPSSENKFSFLQTYPCWHWGCIPLLQFIFFGYVEASSKWVMPHLAPPHQNHKHFVSGEVRKTRLFKQSQFVTDVIQDAKTNPKYFT